MHFLIPRLNGSGTATLLLTDRFFTRMINMKKVEAFEDSEGKLYRTEKETL